MLQLHSFSLFYSRGKEVNSSNSHLGNAGSYLTLANRADSAPSPRVSDIYTLHSCVQGSVTPIETHFISTVTNELKMGTDIETVQKKLVGLAKRSPSPVTDAMRPHFDVPEAITTLSKVFRLQPSGQ